MATNSSSLPIEGEIYAGKVIKIEAFGAFIDVEGFYSNGLVHISQLAKDRVENVEDVVSIGQDVFVKVLSVDAADHPRGRPKISLSMKYADQSTGEDRDRNGIESEREQQRRRAYGGPSQEPVKLDAIYNTVCGKCQGKGHLASECFNVGGTSYDLIPDPDEEGGEEKKPHRRPDVAGVSSYVSNAVAVGRGRGATLPAWMTSEKLPESGDGRGEGRSGGRSRARSSRDDSDSREREHKKRKREKDSKKKKSSKSKKHKKHHKSKSDKKDNSKKSHKDRKHIDRERGERENQHDSGSRKRSRSLSPSSSSSTSSSSRASSGVLP